MTDPEVPLGKTELAGELEPTPNQIQTEGLDENIGPAGWVERLKGIDYRDHKDAIVKAGAAAVALGIGVYALKNRKKFFVCFGDREAEKKGIISIGEIVDNGTSVSAVISAEALEAIKPNKDIFSLDKVDGFGYPFENPDHIQKHIRALRKGVGFLIERFSSSEKGFDSDSKA